MKRTWLVTTAGLVIGAIAGWFYWKWVGCTSGSCRITSDPVNSSVYGAFLGGLLLNTISSFFIKPKIRIENHDKHD